MMMDTAAATSETASAAQNESTWNVRSERLAASRIISASRSRMRMKPSGRVNGSRRAAIRGGISALSTAISAAEKSAPRTPSTETPGTRRAPK